MSRPLDPAHRARILAAYLAGDKVEAIAAEQHVARGTVSRIAQLAGHRRHRGDHRTRHGGVRAIAREYLEQRYPPRGAIKALAAARGVNYHSLHARIAEERAARAGRAPLSPAAAA